MTGSEIFDEVMNKCLKQSGLKERQILFAYQNLLTQMVNFIGEKADLDMLIEFIKTSPTHTSETFRLYQNIHDECHRKSGLE